MFKLSSSFHAITCWSISCLFFSLSFVNLWLSYLFFHLFIGRHHIALSLVNLFSSSCAITCQSIFIILYLHFLIYRHHTVLSLVNQSIVILRFHFLIYQSSYCAFTCQSIVSYCAITCESIVIVSSLLINLSWSCALSYLSWSYSITCQSIVSYCAFTSLIYRHLSIYIILRYHLSIYRIIYALITCQSIVILYYRDRIASLLQSNHIIITYHLWLS